MAGTAVAVAAGVGVGVGAGGIETRNETASRKLPNDAPPTELTARKAGDDAMLKRAVRHLLRYRQLTKRSASAR